MSVAAIVTMVLICGFVWGGFAALLTFAIRREREKLEASGVG
jgi:LPS O-antigen subunit length determinant protein (WzzB/FepE family)